MPHLINGIGTWYLGRSNQRIDRGVCEHCGRFTDLNSYDTTKYFLLIYLPLIPLGKNRVLRECAQCKRHSVLKLKEWQRLRREVPAEAVKAYEGDPTDPAKAGEALGATMAYDRRDAFAHLSTVVVQHLGQDPDTLLALGDALQYFSRPDEAESAFRKAHQLRDDPATREALAVHLMRQGKPEEAQGLLQHILDEANADSLGVLYLLVEAYQVKGDHRSALAVLDAIEMVFPEAAQDKEHKGYRKDSKKREAGGKPIKPVLLAPSQGAIGGSQRGFLGYLAMVIWPVLLILLVGIPLTVMISAHRSVEIYLINGTPRQYAVQVGEDGRVLVPGRPSVLEIPRNQVLTVTIQEPGLDLEPQQVEVRTGFFESFLEDKTRVVNPDRTAVLVWEETEYSENPLPEKEYPYSVHSGKGYYAFEDVDFEFMEFPEEIEVSSGSGAVRRARVGLVPDLSAMEALFWLQGFGEAPGENTSPDLVAHLEARVRFDSEDLEAAQLLGGLDAQRFLPLADARLAERPLRVDWHRLYQEIEEREGRSVGLLERYRGSLVKEPDNGDLLYLVGRIEPDPIQAEALFERAMAADPPSAYGYHGLAYQRLAGAQFDSALSLARQALALMPEDASFRVVEEESLLALGRYDELIERRHEAWKADPEGAEAVLELIQFHAAAGNPDAAEMVIQEELAASATEGGEEDSLWGAYLRANLAYVMEDRAAFVARAEESESLAVQTAFLQGDVATLETLLEEEGATPEQHLLAYLLARRGGEAERAETQLQAAVALLQEGNEEDRRQAELLSLPEGSGSDLPSPETVRALPIEPLRKSVVLATLAARHPARAGEFRALARRLNYQPGFPRLTVRALLES